jgi:hypothetical protein
MLPPFDAKGVALVDPILRRLARGDAETIRVARRCLRSLGRRLRAAERAGYVASVAVFDQLAAELGEVIHISRACLRDLLDTSEDP